MIADVFAWISIACTLLSLLGLAIRYDALRIAPLIQACIASTIALVIGGFSPLPCAATVASFGFAAVEGLPAVRARLARRRRGNPHGAGRRRK